MKTLISIFFTALFTLSANAFATEQWSAYSVITELEFGGTDAGDGIYITLESGSQNNCTDGNYHMSSGDNGYEQISDLAKLAFAGGTKISLSTNGCYGNSENLKRARVNKNEVY